MDAMAPSKGRGIVVCRHQHFSRDNTHHIVMLGSRGYAHIPSAKGKPNELSQQFGRIDRMRCFQPWPTDDLPTDTCKGIEDKTTTKNVGSNVQTLVEGPGVRMYTEHLKPLLVRLIRWRHL